MFIFSSGERQDVPCSTQTLQTAHKNRQRTDLLQRVENPDRRMARLQRLADKNRHASTLTSSSSRLSAHANPLAKELPMPPPTKNHRDQVVQLRRDLESESTKKDNRDDFHSNYLLHGIKFQDKDVPDYESFLKSKEANY
ncbi:MAG: hypothetical protein AAFU03_12430, partial [Bacteroidota bacterium]